MNKDAEKYADDVSLWGDFYDAPEYEGQSGGANTYAIKQAIKQAIISAMEWAYRDAIEACKSELDTEEPYTREEEVAAEEVRHCIDAIEARLK